MSRVWAWVVAVSIMAVLLPGCQAKGLDRSVVERGLAGGAGSNLDRDQIRATGEAAIPMVFDELRAHPGETQLHMTITTLSGMAADGLVDPKAPHLRAVVENTKERESIRRAAAIILGWYGECPEIERALMGRIRHDGSAAVRSACLAALSTRITFRGERAKSWTVNPEAVELFAKGIADKSAEVRKQACASIGCVAVGAIEGGVNLKWCRQLLIRARRDPEYRIRKEAVDMLFWLDQEKRKNKASASH